MASPYSENIWRIIATGLKSNVLRSLVFLISLVSVAAIVPADISGVWPGPVGNSDKVDVAQQRHRQRRGVQ